jgi:pimeloyl-ACP methyl ester carboxylesterase
MIILYGGISYYLATGVTQAERSEFEHTPEEYGLPYQNVEFSSRNESIPLSGWYISEPGKSGRTIIFVHGLGNNRAGDAALELASRLFNNGYDSLLFDLRGHGISGKGRVSGGYFEQNDLLGAFDYLTVNGIASEQIGVVGISLGAGIAILTATKEPSIQALIVDTPYANISDLLIQEVNRTTSLPEWLVPIFIPGAKIAADLVYSIKIGDLVPENAITDIKYPVLIIHGEKDTRVPLDHGIRVHANAHPASSLWVVPEVEHADSLMTYPDEYSQRVLKYLDNRLSGD